MLTLTNITKAFGDVPVLDNVNINVEAGEFVCIVGPSGSGKSTLFNIIAGLERPDSGSVQLDGADVLGQRGHVAYMPQRDALFPWYTVLENAVLAARVTGGDVAATRRDAHALLASFGLEGFGDTRPAALSGGMRQRAALLRTVLWNHPVMLLDEPFGALDALTRAQLHQWLLGLWGRMERTILLVTHDVDEAVLLADRVYVLTPRPARVAFDLPIDLSRPRSYDIITTPTFAERKIALLEALGQLR